MIKIERWKVMNLDGALHGARNPMNSWSRSDSYYDESGEFIVGPADLKLGRGLVASGSDHRKFIRQIFVSVDVTAPLYWWKEYDTYKIGTVANSCSTMHRIHSKSFSQSDFSHDRMSPEALKQLNRLIEFLESERVLYNETKDQTHWHNMIQLLPTSYNQMRTCTMNYENLINIYSARRNHKLAEWHSFCRWIEELPYSDSLILPACIHKKSEC